MKKSGFYTHVFLKKLAIILVCLFSNILFAEENIGEVVAEHIDENFESDVHAALQDGEPESWSSWLNNNIDYYFPKLNENKNSAYIAMGQVKASVENIPSSVAATFNKRMQEIGYYVSPSQTQGNDPNNGANSSSQTPGNNTNNMHNNSANTSTQTQGNNTNDPPITIVMQDGNTAQMSGDKFIAAKIRSRKNVTHATINNDDNIRNVNLKLHSLYMSNIALSR